MDTTLSVRAVSKSYGATRVLTDIRLDVAEGEFLILVGPSGCGKSTLLHMIAGLETITAGDIYIRDRMANWLSPKDRDIAMVFQSYALYPNMNVRQNISFGLEMRKVPKPERERIVGEVARTLQMEHLLNRKPSQLSGGQRQRVAMGRAIARNPTLFLFDEPLSNLDAKLRIEMRHEIKLLHKRTGKTIVYVTHDQIEAMTLGDRIAVMKGGELQQLGAPQDVYDDPANLFVAGFMGSPPMNFIPCRVEGAGSGLGVVLESNGRRTVCPVDGAQAALRPWLGKDITMGLRPEKITARPELLAAPFLTATVELTEPTGPDTLVLIRVNGTDVTCRVLPQHARRHGEAMDLAFDVSKAVFFEPGTERRLA